MIPLIIIPDAPPHEYLIRLVRAQYQIWLLEKEAREPKFVAENVRFEHDPYWRDGFWSVQSAHDGRHWGWQIVRVTYLAAAVAPYLVRPI